MISFTSTFVLSQIAVGIAMIFDFLSFQFKKREKTFLLLAISASLIATHYFLLDRRVAGVITVFSVARFITCYFTTNKKAFLVFLVLNTIAAIFVYQEIYDLIMYSGSVVFLIGNFQRDNRLMRKIMMIGTSLVVLYNTVIFSPMGMILEGAFLTSNFIGYFKHYIRKNHSEDVTK